MDDWLPSLPAAVALLTIAGVAATRTYRARAVLLLVVGCACGAFAVAFEPLWLRIGYAVLAFVAAFMAGGFWSRPGRSVQRSSGAPEGPTVRS